MASVGGFRLRAVLLGAPGVGKGTVARRLSPHFNAAVISTGDIIREQIRIGSNNAKLLRHITDAGQLIPDDLVMEIVDEKLGSLGPDQNFILDGFPRTTTQANSLDTSANLNLVLKLHLPQEVLVQKITARRVCQNCGEGYNLADIKYKGVVLKPLLPKRPGFCDKCSGRLLQRSDDKELVVRRRLEVFQNETAPLNEFYQQKNILLNFCIYNGVQDLPLLISAVENALNDGAALRE